MSPIAKSVPSSPPVARVDRHEVRPATVRGRALLAALPALVAAVIWHAPLAALLEAAVRYVLFPH
ncbi:MAG: hypothetical protein R2752_17255 [Vicinamibacterales bacterium]